MNCFIPQVFSWPRPRRVQHPRGAHQGPEEHYGVLQGAQDRVHRRGGTSRVEFLNAELFLLSIFLGIEQVLSVPLPFCDRVRSHRRQRRLRHVGSR